MDTEENFRTSQYSEVELEILLKMFNIEGQEKEVLRRKYDMVRT